MSAADSLATSERNADPVDDESLESVDDEVADDALEALDTLDDELVDSSAASRLVRSVSSVDSRLLALDELSVALDDELESLALETPGGGPGGGPPTPLGAPAPPLEASLVELWPLSEETPLSCDRNASTAADSPIAVDASEDVIELLADAEVEALVLVVSEELFWLAKLVWSSRNKDCVLKPEMDIDMGLPPNLVGALSS